MFAKIAKFPVAKYNRYNKAFARNVAYSIKFQAILPSLLRKIAPQAVQPILKPIVDGVSCNHAYLEKESESISSKILSKLNLSCTALFVNPSLNILNGYTNQIDEVAAQPPNRLKIGFNTASKIKKFVGNNGLQHFTTDIALRAKTSKSCAKKGEEDSKDKCSKKKRKNAKKSSGTCPYIKEECKKGGKKGGFAGKDCKKLTSDPCGAKKKKAKKAHCKAKPCKKSKTKSDSCASKLKKSKSDPCASKAKKSKSDPCASKSKKAKSDPCASKAKKSKSDPCASKGKKAKSDPCASKGKKAKSDPCDSEAKESKSDPCASKAKKSKSDPCASKGKKAKSDPCASEEKESKSDPCASEAKKSKSDSKKKSDPCSKSIPCKKKGGKGSSSKSSCMKSSAVCKDKGKGGGKGERKICPPHQQKKGKLPDWLTSFTREWSSKIKESSCDGKGSGKKGGRDPCKVGRGDPCKKKSKTPKKKVDPCEERGDPCKNKKEPTC